MGRMDAIAGEYRKTKEGNKGKYDYVDTRALERMGIIPYKMKDTNFVRIISPQFSQYPADQLPFYGKEIFIHTDIGADQRTYICPRKMLNQPCPICEFSDSIRAKNENDERLRALWPSRRYLFFIYDVTDTETEKLGLHWFDAPGAFKHNIISLSKDRRTGDFIDVSDPQTGKDIEFERVGKGIQTKYEGFKLMDNSPPPKEWYTNAPDDFEEYLLYPTYEQLQAAMGLAAQQPVENDAAPAEQAVQDPPVRSRQQESAPQQAQSSEPVVQDPPTRARGSATPQPQQSTAVEATRVAPEMSPQDAVRQRIQQLRGA